MARFLPHAGLRSAQGLPARVPSACVEQGRGRQLVLIPRRQHAHADLSAEQAGQSHNLGNGVRAQRACGRPCDVRFRRRAGFWLGTEIRRVRSGDSTARKQSDSTCRKPKIWLSADKRVELRFDSSRARLRRPIRPVPLDGAPQHARAGQAVHFGRSLAGNRQPALVRPESVLVIRILCQIHPFVPFVVSRSTASVASDSNYPHFPYFPAQLMFCMIPRSQAPASERHSPKLRFAVGAAPIVYKTIGSPRAVRDREGASLSQFRSPPPPVYSLNACKSPHFGLQFGHGEGWTGRLPVE